MLGASFYVKAGLENRTRACRPPAAVESRSWAERPKRWPESRHPTSQIPSVSGSLSHTGILLGLTCWLSRSGVGPETLGRTGVWKWIRNTSEALNSSGLLPAGWDRVGASVSGVERRFSSSICSQPGGSSRTPGLQNKLMPLFCPEKKLWVQPGYWEKCICDPEVKPCPRPPTLGEFLFLAGTRIRYQKQRGSSQVLVLVFDIKEGNLKTL